MSSNRTYRSHPTNQTTKLTANIPEEKNGQLLPQNNKSHIETVLFSGFIVQICIQEQMHLQKGYQPTTNFQKDAKHELLADTQLF